MVCLNILVENVVIVKKSDVITTHTWYRRIWWLKWSCYIGSVLNKGYKRSLSLKGIWWP